MTTKDLLQKSNLAKLKDIMSKITLNHISETAVSMVNKINKNPTLAGVISTGVINIDNGNPFNKLDAGSTLIFSAVGNTDGEVTFTVTMTTAGAKTPISAAVIATPPPGDSDFHLHELANLEYLDNKMNAISKLVPKAGYENKKASDIAAEIGTDMAKLKDIFGAGFAAYTPHISAHTTLTSVTGGTDGTFVISFAVVTVYGGHTSAIHHHALTVHLKSDAEIVLAKITPAMVETELKKTLQIVTTRGPLETDLPTPQLIPFTIDGTKAVVHVSTRTIEPSTGSIL